MKREDAKSPAEEPPKRKRKQSTLAGAFTVVKTQSLSSGDPSNDFSSFAELHGGSPRDERAERDAGEGIARAEALARSRPSVAMPEARGAEALKGDFSIRRSVTLSSSSSSAFAWASAISPEHEVIALDGVGLGELSPGSPAAARLLHALQFFEFRGGSESGEGGVTPTEAISSLIALCASGRVSCFHVLCGSFSVLFRKSCAVVHPPSAARVLVQRAPGETAPTPASAPTQPNIDKEELDALEKSASSGLIVVKRAGESGVEEAAAAAATDRSNPAAVIEGDAPMRSLITALVAVLGKRTSTAVVVSPRAFFGGTLRRGKVRTFLSKKPISGSKLEEVAVLEISDVLLAQEPLLRILEIVAEQVRSDFSASFDTDSSTTGLGTSPGSFLTGATWRVHGGLSFTVAVSK